MTTITLVHPEETFTIPTPQALTKCSLFQNNPTLSVSPYQVQSPVSLSTFRVFLSALAGKTVTITDTNFTELRQLSDEFGFSDLSPLLSAFRPSKERRAIEVLQDKVTQLTADFSRLAVEVSALRSASAGIQTLSDEVSALKSQRSDPVVAQLSADFSELRKDVAFLKAQITAIPGVFDSRIISKFPEIFTEFRGKRSSLLWRGSRDGFKAKEFHRRCDDHPNTMTLILDTKGNIFGGFTPVRWESREYTGKVEDYYKADESLRSFLFTLKNPHNGPARRFALKPEKVDQAIWCDSERGVCFGDIAVVDDCNVSTGSYTWLGESYINDTGLHRDVFFTGSGYFQVEEIEVFEIIN